MRGPGTRTGTWVAALLSLFLVFVLPACATGLMMRAWIDQGGPGSSNSNTNEEREEREGGEEVEAVRRLTRPPPAPRSQHAADGRSCVVALPVPGVLVAQLAPIPHPSRFSERRQQ